MAKRVMRQALVVHGTRPVSVIVLPPDAEGDAYLAAYDGIIVVPDVEDEYGEDFVTLTDCVAVEITGMEPMPGVGSGWQYADGVFIPPQPFPSWTWEDGAWTPPVPYPDDGGSYEWDEESQSWATVDRISEQGDD